MLYKIVPGHLLIFSNLIKASRHYTEYSFTVCYAHFISYLLQMQMILQNHLHRYT